MRAAGPAEGHLAPVLVSPDPEVPGRYRVRDGKHRYLAHLVLGRERVRCVVVGAEQRPGPRGGLPDVDE